MVNIKTLKHYEKLAPGQQCSKTRFKKYNCQISLNDFEQVSQWELQ